MSGNSGINVGFGTIGQVLTSNGNGNLPTFQNLGLVSGALIFLEQQLVTGVSEVEFLNVIDTTYDNYLLIYDMCEIIGDSYMGESLIIQFSINSGSSYISTGYNNGRIDGVNVSSVTSGIVIGFTLDVTSDSVRSGRSYIQNVTATNNIPQCYGDCYQYSPTYVFVPPLQPGTYPGGTYTPGSISVDALRVVMTDGSNFSGKFSLYGFLQ